MPLPLAETALRSEHDQPLARATLPPSGEDETALSSGVRPDPLAGPALRRLKREVEAALFGGHPDAATIGRYRLLHRLGEGGMGLVYAAFDERLDRKVALKLIRPSRSESHQTRERTLREARALAKLSHPHVVHVYEVGEFDEQIFIAMEFLAGPTLRAWLDAEERPWRQVLAVLRQAGEGLAAAHAEGIVHRDFKPQNAIFGADGRVRVLDFGLARLDGADDTRSASSGGDARASTLTVTGLLLGTPAYMAPEQFDHAPTTAQTDQFSFCVVLYEALYGRRPFPGRGVQELAASVTSGRVLPRPRNTEVPEWVHAAVLRGLQVDPAARWPSMHALLAALGGDLPVRRRAPVRAAALSVALAGTLGGVLWRSASLQSEGDEQRARLQQEAEAAHAATQRQTAATLIATARGQLDADPLATIRLLAEAAELAPDDGPTLPEIRMLALAATARGLPDAVLTGPGAAVVGLDTASRSGHLFAADESGEVWRWTPGQTRAEKVGALAGSHRLGPVAPDGGAWTAEWTQVFGAREHDGRWQTWRRELPRDPEGYLKVANKITDDGRWAVSDFREPVVAWDVATGDAIEGAFPPAAVVSAASRVWATPDARYLARSLAGSDSITVWSRADGVTRTLPAHGRFHEFLGTSVDSRWLLGSSVPLTADHTRPVVWDLQTGQSRTWDGRGDFAGVAGDRVALLRTTDAGPSLCLATIPDGACALQRPIADVSARVHLAADGRAHAVETRGRLELADHAGGLRLRRLQGSRSAGGELGRDGHYYLARGPEVDVWTAQNPAHELVDVAPGWSPDSADRVTWVASPRGETVVRRTLATGELERVDTASGAATRLARTFERAGEDDEVVVGDDGRVLVVHEGEACLHPGDGAPPICFTEPGATVHRALLSPDGRGFALLFAGGSGELWADPTATPRRFDAGPGDYHYMQYAADGDAIVTTTSEVVRVHDEHGVRELFAGAPADRLVTTDHSRNGRWIVTDPGAGSVLVHDVEAGTTRAPAPRLPPIDAGFHSIDISDDGRIVARTTGTKIYVIDAGRDTLDTIELGVRFRPSLLEPAGTLLFVAAEDGLRAVDLASRTSAVLWPIASQSALMRLNKAKFFVTPDDVLVVHDDREVHRLALGGVPREPAALRAWLRRQRERLSAARG